MHRFSLVLIALSAWASITGFAVAEEVPVSTLKRIADSKTIRLGYLRESAPFSFVVPSGDPAGYSVDLCQRVADGVRKQLNLVDISIKWVPLTLANRFDMVANGGIDLECGTSTNTIARQKQVDFSLMTWVDGGNFLVKPDRPYRTLADLAGARIAVIGGTTTEAALRSALTKAALTADIVPVTEHLEGLNALDRGQVAAYASDQTVLIGLALAIRDQMAVKLGEQNFSFEPYGLALRRNDADFKQAVNQVLARLYRSGEIVQIYDRWFGKLGKPSPVLIVMFELNGLPE